MAWPVRLLCSVGSGVRGASRLRAGLGRCLPARGRPAPATARADGLSGAGAADLTGIGAIGPSAERSETRPAADGKMRPPVKARAGRREAHSAVTN